VGWFATGLIEVRRRIQRIGDKGERPAFDPSIFRSRYLQLTRRDHLSDAQYVHLIGVVSQDLELWHAWRLVQMLYGVYQAGTEAEAAKRIEEFVPREAEANHRQRLEVFELTVERARFEADRARRQFDPVEPENRLAARNLERSREDKLAQLR
jgi:hypothetical protein